MTKRLSPGARYAQLLRAAVLAAEAHGLAAVNHRMISESTGVSVPSVFTYFKTSDMITEQVVVAFETGDVHPMAAPRAYAEAMLHKHGAKSSAALLAAHFVDLLEATT